MDVPCVPPKVFCGPVLEKMKDRKTEKLSSSAYHKNQIHNPTRCIELALQLQQWQWGIGKVELKCSEKEAKAGRNHKALGQSIYF